MFTGFRVCLRCFFEGFEHRESGGSNGQRMETRIVWMYRVLLGRFHAMDVWNHVGYCIQSGFSG